MCASQRAPSRAPGPPERSERLGVGPGIVLEQPAEPDQLGVMGILPVGAAEASAARTFRRMPARPGRSNGVSA